jgi:putative membrane protein
MNGGILLQMPMGGGYSTMGYGMGWGWMIFGWLFMILFWVAVVLLVIWLIKQLKGPRGPATAGETPLEILKTRYARGEITREQYKEMREELEA